jgi:hypothetical protein
MGEDSTVYVGFDVSKVKHVVAIAYFQPGARGELSAMFEREISHDLIASLRAEGLIAAGPRSPTPGADYAYAATRKFLDEFGFESLRDLPDLEVFQDAGLIQAEAANGDAGGRRGPLFLRPSHARRIAGTALARSASTLDKTRP